MLEKSKEKLLNTAELSLGDAELLPYENDYFDLLICSDSFHHYPNPQKAIEEFYRVLKTDLVLLIQQTHRLRRCVLIYAILLIKRTNTMYCYLK